MLNPDLIEAGGETLEPVEVELARHLPPDHPPFLHGAGRMALRLLPIPLLAAAAWVLWREFHAIALGEVLRAIANWGVGAIAGALALSAVSFLLMGVVEWLGLRWTGARLPWGLAMAGSFLSNAIAHSLGANLLVSGAVRAKFYGPYGVGLRQVAGATLFGGMSFAFGLSALSGAGLLLASRQELAATAISTQTARTLGVLLLAGVMAYLLLCALRRRPLTGFGHSLTLPSFAAALGQLLVGVADNATAAAIIWILLPDAHLSYQSFVGAYAIACVAGLISTVPGGAGVFESALATLLPGVAAPALAAAFLGYRLAYYLLPLFIASIALGGETVRRGRKG